MAKEIILKRGNLNVSFGGGFTATVDALYALTKIGYAYKLLSGYEAKRDTRVMLVESPERALIIEQNISYHGSEMWEKVGTLTRDPDEIERYLAFRTIRSYLRELEYEESKKQQEQKGLTSLFEEDPLLESVIAAPVDEHALADVYRQQNEEAEPTFYDEYGKKAAPTMDDLFGEQHDPTLDEVFGKS